VARIETLPHPRLDTRDLRVGLALASAGTTARAAPLLHLTQPAVSRALLTLEEKLGTRIFERTARGLVPTAAGELFLSGATRLLAELGDLEERLHAVETPTRVRLVCECYTAYHWLPSALAGMRRSLPGLELQLQLDHTGDPAAALEAGEIDAALLTTAAAPRGIEERDLFADEVTFIVAASHPLASRRTLTRRDLEAYPLLCGRAPPAERDWFLRALYGRKRPRLRFERLPLTEAILDVTRTGAGIAVLSEWIASPHLARGDLVAKRLSSGPLRRPWRIAYRREVGEAALRLIAALRATVPQPRMVG
jgi:LysR family transcriptional regulator for metE and metH